MEHLQGKITASGIQNFTGTMVSWLAFDSLPLISLRTQDTKISEERMLATIQFIVTACNSYYDNKRKADAYPKLVEALRRAAGEIDELSGGIHDYKWIATLLTELGEL
jgi:hypothetical protein